MENYKKKYEDALERAKVINPGTADYEVAVKIFPELKESEDEKIRKEIRDFICWAIDIGSITKEQKKQSNSWIAWLEKQEGRIHIRKELFEHLKQSWYKEGFMDGKYSGTSFEYNGHTWGMCARDNGVDILLDKQFFKHLEVSAEQKPSDKVEPKFKIGDYIINGHGFIMQIDGIDGDMYCYHVLDNNRLLKHDITKTDESCHLWKIQDAKDGDVIYYKSPLGIEYIVMSSGVNRFGNVDSYFRYNSVDGFGISVPSVLSTKVDNITPATEEQRDFLFKEMKEAGYEWDAKKKELKKIEKKPAWSEENERMYQETIDWFEKKCFPYALESENPARESINWLKSLKERLKGE